MQTSLATAVKASDANVIKTCIDDLNSATEQFAVKRINASVKKMLTGRSIDEIIGQDNSEEKS